MELLHECLQDILYVVLTIILPITVKYAAEYTIQYIDSKKTVENEDILTAAEQTVSNIVVSVNQTYVESLKDSGEFTKETGVVAFNRARALAVTLISEDAQKLIKSLYGDFEKWLTVTIETYVNVNK